MRGRAPNGDPSLSSSHGVGRRLRAVGVTALPVSEVLRVAAAYADATRAGDLAALEALTEDDAVVWHNFDDAIMSAAASRKTLAWIHKRVVDVTWEDVATLPTPEGYVWRSTLTGTAPGGPLRASTCVVVTLSDAGKVARIDEYLDSAATAVLATPA